MQKLPTTRHDPKLDPHTDECAYRRDVQLELQHGLFTVFQHHCNCGVWAAPKPGDGVRVVTFVRPC